VSEDEKKQSPSLFEWLKNQREQKGISLKDISEQTHISMKYLNDIENGNLGNIPPVYDKLFFQSYVRYLKLENEEEILQEFRALRRSMKSVPKTTIRRIVTQPEDPAKAHLLRMLYFSIPAVILIGFLIFLLMNSSSVESTRNSDVQELSVKQIALEQTMAADTLKAAADSLKAQDIQQPTVHITLKAVDRTWLRMIKDRRDTTEYLLTAGKQISVTADSLVLLLVGNAGGIDFTVNGEHVGVLGNNEQVITNMVVTAQGIVNKKIKNARRKHVAQQDSVSAR